LKYCAAAMQVQLTPNCRGPENLLIFQFNNELECALNRQSAGEADRLKRLHSCRHSYLDKWVIMDNVTWEMFFVSRKFVSNGMTISNSSH
jgi:hypothetical protein